MEPTPTLITRTESVRQRPMVAVSRGQLIEAIRTTARVEALNRAELAFKTDGRVKGVYVTQGDAVEEGDVLAELETGRLESDIESSQEALQNAELRLDAARTRARDERAAAQRAVANAELTVEQLRTAFDKLIRRAAAEQLEALGVDRSTREDRGDVDLGVTEAEAALVRAQRAVTNAEGRLAEVKAEAAGVISEAQAAAQAQASLDGLKADLTVAIENLRALESGTATTGASPRESARAQVGAAVEAVCFGPVGAGAGGAGRGECAGCPGRLGDRGAVAGDGRGSQSKVGHRGQEGRDCPAGRDAARSDVPAVPAYRGGRRAEPGKGQADARRDQQPEFARERRGQAASSARFPGSATRL